MEKYLVCEDAYAYGIFLCHARRFTEEEKKHYAEWYREKGFVGTSNSVALEEITRGDVNDILNDRPEDGSFQGCGNSAFIITKDEWNILVNLNQKRMAEKNRKKISDKIEECNQIIAACEKQEKLYTKEEAVKKRKAYNNLYNEGGEGFVPHYYTINEYEYAKEQLKKLTEALEYSINDLTRVK